MTAEPTTSQERIRAAIVEWDRGKANGVEPGSFVYLLTEAERTDLAATIDMSVFGPKPDTWVGPQLKAAELQHLRALAAIASKPLRDALRHIDCQSATIRNENAENERLRDRVAELEGELGRLRGALALRKAVAADA